MIVSCEQPAFHLGNGSLWNHIQTEGEKKPVCYDCPELWNMSTRWKLLWLISPGRLKPTTAFFRTMRTHQTGSAVPIVDQLVFNRAILENLSFLLQDWMVFALATGVPNFPSAFRTQCLHRDAECITEGLLLVSSLLLYKICIFVPIRPFYIHGWVVHLLPCSKEYAKVRHVTAGKFTALL